MKMFKITELDSRNHIIKNTEQKKAEEMFGECFWRAYRISVQFSVEPIINKERNEFGSEYIPNGWSAISSGGITPSKYTAMIIATKKVKKK